MRAPRRLVNGLAISALATGIVLGGPGAVLGGEPGDLDPSFGRDGVRTIDFGEHEAALAVFVDGAGRLRLGGVWRRGEQRLALTRLEPDGSIDRSYGERGTVLVDPSERGHAQPSAWAVAPDDDLVVLGSDGAGGSDKYLARFQADGALDRSFGEDGLLHFALPDSSLTFNLAIQPNGRILTLSRIDTGSLITARRPSGTRARGFGQDGHVMIERNHPGLGSLLSRPDGRILVVGTPKRLASERDPMLVIDGLLPDGSPDRAFGDDGRAAMPIAFPRAEVVIDAAALTPRGKIVVAGQIGIFSSDTFVARFTADGRPDRSFGGGDGWRSFDIGPIDQPSAIVRLHRGNLAIVGNVIHDRFGDEPGSGMFLAALRRDGRFRERFGQAGISHPGGDDAPAAFDGTLTDGGLVVVGAADRDMFAARYLLGAR